MVRKNDCKNRSIPDIAPIEGDFLARKMLQLAVNISLAIAKIVQNY